MKGLTQKQKAILDFIEEFYRREGIPPTVYEIAEHFDIKPATSFAHLRALQRKGYVDRTSKARSLTLLKSNFEADPNPILSIPILGKISAGLPLLSEANIDDVVKLDPSLLPWGIGTQKLFALRVNGDSMKEAAILDGDIIVAKQQQTADNGEIVVALVDGESTVKYFHAKDGRIELHPANDAYEVQVYEPDMVQIQGVVSALVRSL